LVAYIDEGLHNAHTGIIDSLVISSPPPSVPTTVLVFVQVLATPRVTGPTGFHGAVPEGFSTDATELGTPVSDAFGEHDSVKLGV
jgi:hypothetical protein